MLRRIATFAVAWLSLAYGAVALDAIQSTVVPGRLPPASFCSSAGSAGGIAINRADGTLAFCGPGATLSAPRVLLDPTKALGAQLQNLDLSAMTVTAGGTTQPLATWLPGLAPLASPAFTGTPTGEASGMRVGNARVAARVANSTDLANALPIAAVVARDGFAAAGDGGRATYAYSATACSISGGDGGSQIPSNYGGCWNIDWSSVRGEATPELFAGAIGFVTDGSNSAPDAQPAVQKALNTGRTVRFRSPYYRMNRQATITTPGQEIAGLGTGATALVVFPGFDLSSGNSILGLNPANFNQRQLAPFFHDFKMKVFQPEVTAASDTSLTDVQRLNSLIQVNCINARAGYSGKFVRLVLAACMDGIDLRGDTGQTVIEDYMGSNFIADVDLDGALDTTRISKHHNFPTHVTPNQAALQLRMAIAIRSGRMDDLKVTDSMCISAKWCYYSYVGTQRTIASDGYVSPGGITTAQFSNYNFDIVQMGWRIEGGSTVFIGGYYASTAGGQLANGSVTLSGTNAMTIQSNNFFQVSGGQFTITGCPAISDPNTDFTFLYLTGGYATMSGNTYGWNPSAAATLTRPKVLVANTATLVATGNLVFPLNASSTVGSAAGFFSVSLDNGTSVVANNSMQNWKNIFPLPVLGTYGPNAGANDFMSQGFPSYAQVTASWTPATAQQKTFTIRDAAGDFSYGGIPAGGGSRVGRMMSDGSNFRYF